MSNAAAAPLDPYSVLQLRRDADEESIRRAYRKLSMQYHPDRAADTAVASEKFTSVAEAYDVLITPSTRALLDKQGLVALGMQYTFTKDPRRVFEGFFGTGNPFSVIQETTTANARQAIAAPPTQVKELACTLEELHTGCVKRLRVTRMISSADGLDVVPDDVEVDVVVQPGYCSGTTITFKGKGDALPGLEAADMSFVVREKVHATYQRQGNDLIYQAQITLAQALGRCELPIRTLDGRGITADCNQVLDPSSTVIVKGEGMAGAGGARGDLIIHFSIAFPQHLTPEEQDQIATILVPKFNRK